MKEEDMYECVDECYVAEMDEETVDKDFDEIDLFGEKLIEDDDNDKCDIEFE